MIKNHYFFYYQIGFQSFSIRTGNLVEFCIYFYSKLPSLLSSIFVLFLKCSDYRSGGSSGGLSIKNWLIIAITSSGESSSTSSNIFGQSANCFLWRCEIDFSMKKKNCCVIQTLPDCITITRQTLLLLFIKTFQLIPIKYYCQTGFR